MSTALQASATLHSGSAVIPMPSGAIQCAILSLLLAVFLLGFAALLLWNFRAEKRKVAAAFWIVILAMGVVGTTKRALEMFDGRVVIDHTVGTVVVERRYLLWSERLTFRTAEVARLHVETSTVRRRKRNVRVFTPSLVLTSGRLIAITSGMESEQSVRAALERASASLQRRAA